MLVGKKWGINYKVVDFNKDNIYVVGKDITRDIADEMIALGYAKLVDSIVSVADQVDQEDVEDVEDTEDLEAMKENTEKSKTKKDLVKENKAIKGLKNKTKK